MSKWILYTKCGTMFKEQELWTLYYLTEQTNPVLYVPMSLCTTIYLL